MVQVQAMTNISFDRSDDDIRDFGSAGASEPELIEPLPVPVMPVKPRTRYTDQPVRPSSNFVAQLMAVERDCQQTRNAHRAEPDQVMAAYRSAKANVVGARTRRMS
jgi:hypothetical protein